MYQMGNQNPYIGEEQTTQWPKEKVQKDKQRYTKHTYKTKDRETRTPGTILWTDVDVEIATRKMRVDGCREKGSQAKKHYRPIETIG
jgi:hypothetical protein